MRLIVYSSLLADPETAPKSPERVNVQKMYSNSFDDDDEDDGAVYSLTKPPPRKARGVLILDDEETGVMSDHDTLHVDESNVKRQKMHEMIFYWLCRLCMLAGVVLIVIAVVITTKDRREERKSPASRSFETPTLSPTLFPTANQVARQEWMVRGQILEGQAAMEQFGSSVAISADGSTLAVGALQHVYGRTFQGYVQVYQFDELTEAWTMMGQELEGEEQGDDYGYAVSLSEDGKTLATSVMVGNSDGRGIGHVRVFQFREDSRQWKQIGNDLVSGESHDDVVLSSNGKAVAFVENTDQLGYQMVHVAAFDGQEWEQLGQPLGGRTGTAVTEQQQQAAQIRLGNGIRSLRGLQWKKTISPMHVDLSSDGRTVAIGGDVYEHADQGLSPNILGLGTAIKVLQYNTASSNWTQMGQDLFGMDDYDGFGSAFALSGNGKILAAASPYFKNSGSSVGQIRVYKFDETSLQWYPLGEPILGQASAGYFGKSLALSEDGMLLIAAAPGDDTGRIQAFRFDYALHDWIIEGQALMGAGVDDEFGHAVALSADGRYVVGTSRAHDHTSAGANAGHVQVFQWLE